MTIEDIVGCSASQLEAMTDEQLLEHFKSFLDVTRPERQVVKHMKQEQQMVNPKLAAGLELLKNMGVEVGDSLKPIKKVSRR